jgi:hypothetical protein
MIQLRMYPPPGWTVGEITIELCFKLARWQQLAVPWQGVARPRRDDRAHPRLALIFRSGRGIDGADRQGWSRIAGESSLFCFRRAALYPADWVERKEVI